MTRVKSINEIGSAYEEVRKAQQNIVEEKASAPIKETFPKAEDKKPDIKKLQEKGSDKNAFIFKDSGPAGKSGKSNLGEINDPKYKKNTGIEKFSISLEKTGSKEINNFMSKSIFDKLFEDVMGDDALDLGIKAGPEGAEGDNNSADLDLSTGGDTVSITLDKDVAKKLHEVLMAALDEGEDESEADLGSEVSDEDNEEKKEDKEEEKSEEDNEEIAGEAIEAEELGTPVSGKVRGGEPTSPKGTANVVKGTVSSLAKHGKGGDGKVKDGIDGKGTDAGHALVGSGVKGGAPTSPKGRSNVVSGVVKGGGKGDQNLFQAN